MRIVRRWTLAEELRKLYGQPLAVKAAKLWRQSWEELPAVMASVPVCLLGFAAMTFAYTKSDESYVPKYHTKIVVYRPDDPKVQTINHQSGLD